MLIVALFGLSGCMGGPVERFLRGLGAVADVLAWLCPLLFAIVFVGGGIAAMVKLRAAPTERARSWAKRFGYVNAIAGGLFLVSVLSDPPQIVEVTMGPSGRVEEVAGPDGTVATREVYGPVQRRNVGVDVASFAPLVGIGLGVMALGVAGIVMARRRKGVVG